jgi:hypothetical protein
MKDYIKHTESRMTDLQQMLQQKDQEINFLRSMLGKLSEKVESLEKAVEGNNVIFFHEQYAVPANLTSVCKSWHSFFEPSSFSWSSGFVKLNQAKLSHICVFGSILFWNFGST